MIQIGDMVVRRYGRLKDKVGQVRMVATNHVNVLWSDGRQTWHTVKTLKRIETVNVVNVVAGSEEAG